GADRTACGTCGCSASRGGCTPPRGKGPCLPRGKHCCLPRGKRCCLPRGKRCCLPRGSSPCHPSSCCSLQGGGRSAGLQITWCPTEVLQGSIPAHPGHCSPVLGCRGAQVCSIHQPSSAPPFLS
uniref:Uncharacterized protein n=1 Tax=Serinus canaria TaxID=9135 RepID=A0A8C9MH12_SERCA